MTWLDPHKDHPARCPKFEIRYSDGQTFAAEWLYGFIALRDPDWQYLVRPTEKFFKSRLKEIPAGWKEPRFEAWREL